ncbi:MAG: hypothetical protein IKY04_04785 [Lachnospiraceae bacterium]|nr:hypothetical protein [Lachnospiraceae bacterium]MBR4993544.1 hypothetical protein [Lachnospiraceae bacterium]
MITYDLLTDKKDFLKNFNRKNYPTAFENYRKKLFDALDGVTTDDAKKGAEELISKIQEEEATLKKRHKEGFFIDLRVIIALYLLPAAKEIDTDVSNAFSETLLSKWNETFPGPEIQASTFEVINNGFKKSIGEMFGFRRG